MTSANPSLSAIFAGLQPIRQQPNVRCCFKPTVTSARMTKPWKSVAEWEAKVIEWKPTGATATTEDFHDTEEQADGVCHLLAQNGFGGERIHFPLRVWVEKNFVPGCRNPGRDYFLFPGGIIRRQVGQGHSTAERKARKKARRLQKESVTSGILTSLYAIAAALVSRDPSLRPCQS